jgi:hypothetical protein
MKRKLPAMRFIALACLLVLVLLIASTAVYAQTAGYSLPWWTSDGGGGDSSGGQYSLSATIGQPDAGALMGGRYLLNGGFWSGIGGATPPQRVYLPLTTKL